jgi:cell wall-associated NlpC family hydrolase
MQGMLPRLAVLILLTAVVAGCASTGAVPRPFPGAPIVTASPKPPTPSDPAAAPGDPVTAPADVPPPVAAPIAPLPVPPEVVITALALQGTPYRYGGSDPSGFDCSGLVQWVFRQHGVVLPREARDQFQSGTTIAPEDLRPGDLVFFATERRGDASHVGIVLDQDTFVHAPNSRGVVRIERLELDYWSKRYLGARRVH